MRINFSGQNQNDSTFIEDAFFDSFDTLDSLSFTLNSPSRITMVNSNTGITTTFEGSGFSLGQGQVPGSGTITTLTAVRGGVTLGTVSDITWPAQELIDALLVAEAGGGLSQIADLYNSNGPINITTNGAGTGFEMTTFFDYNPVGQNLSDLITQPITVDGTDLRDFLVGGQGNDTINPGANPDTGDRIIATRGNDTYDLRDAGPNSWYSFDYRTFSGLTADIDIGANTGTISGAGSFDTFVGLQSAPWYVEWYFTDAGDAINVTADNGNFLAFNASGGNDAYDIVLDSGFVRLTHSRSQPAWAAQIPST